MLDHGSGSEVRRKIQDKRCEPSRGKELSFTARYSTTSSCDREKYKVEIKREFRVPGNALAGFGGSVKVALEMVASSSGPPSSGFASNYLVSTGIPANEFRGTSLPAGSCPS